MSAQDVLQFVQDIRDIGTASGWSEMEISKAIHDAAVGEDGMPKYEIEVGAYWCRGYLPDGSPEIFRWDGEHWVLTSLT